MEIELTVCCSCINTGIAWQFHWTASAHCRTALPAVSKVFIESLFWSLGAHCSLSYAFIYPGLATLQLECHLHSSEHNLWQISSVVRHTGPTHSVGLGVCLSCSLYICFSFQNLSLILRMEKSTEFSLSAAAAQGSGTTVQGPWTGHALLSVAAACPGPIQIWYLCT